MMTHPLSDGTRQDAASPAPRLTTSLDRAQILDATAVVLRRSGYDGTTIRAIAAELNCAVGSIYRYFEDKRDLLDAVCQRRFEALAEHAELGMEPVRGAALYARTAAEAPDLYRLMFWLSSQRKNGLPRVLERILDGWQRSLSQPGEARRFWAALHGALMEGLAADEALVALGLAQPAAAQLEAAPATVPAA